MTEVQMENRYTSPKDPPWWMKQHPFFMNLWENPVFQRNYARTRIKNAVPPMQAFIASLVMSFVINAIMYLALMNEYAETRVSSSFFVTVVGTVGALAVVTYVRMFLICLTTTSIELRRDLDDGSLHLLFTVPISDIDLYYAETLPSFIKGLEVINSLLTVLLGALIPYLIFNLAGALPYILAASDFMEEIFLALLILYMVISGLIFMMLLFSLASGIHALMFPTFGAVFATLIHYGITSWLTYAISGVGTQMLQPSGYGSNVGVIVFFLFLMIKTAVVIGACVVTARWGRTAFSKARRQGYYEQKRAAVSGLRR